MRITSLSRRRLVGTVRVPGDKSIAHRILILAAMARGSSFLRGIPRSADVDATLACLAALGVRLERAGDAVRVEGLGERRFGVPDVPLDCGGSATTMRLLLGALAGRGQGATLTGDSSLRVRPMDRIIEPLERMGASFETGDREGYAPVTIQPGGQLEGMEIELPVASAQVKTALILAGLSARGRTELSGRIDSRDHTERLVPRMGGSLVVTGERIVVEPGLLQAVGMTLPGDPSSAANFIAAATLIGGSVVTLPGVSVNPTRVGFMEAVSWMGGHIGQRESGERDGEPVSDLEVRAGELRAIEIPEEAVPTLIDEIPLLTLLATQARGRSLIRGISEARLKESDRISAVVRELSRMGAKLSIEGEDLVVDGPTSLSGAQVDAHGDHRIAMMLGIAARIARGATLLEGAGTVEKSWPGFHESLEALIE